jgi:Flp pilus assembly protein TadG
MDKQRGSVSVLTVLMLPVMLAFAALAVDIAYFQVVRSELQNDADAAAMAGARYLYSGGAVTPNWSAAAQAAQSAIALNSAAGRGLSQGTVQTGYWNMANSPWSLQSLPMVPTVNDAPAVQVTVAKATGQNQGPVQTFFARILGIFTQPLQATAVAGPTSPNTIDSGVIFPFVMTRCMYDTYWNSNTYPPGPRSDPRTNRPYVFNLGSTYHYGPCSSGQWTSLLVDSNNVPTIRDLISNRNPQALSIGQSIWVQPGTMTTLYQTTQACSAAGTRSCEYVVIAIVDNIDTHNHAPIRAFACLRFLNAVSNRQYIQAEMSASCSVPSSSGIGTNYGVVSPPSLFR